MIATNWESSVTRGVQQDNNTAHTSESEENVSNDSGDATDETSPAAGTASMEHKSSNLGWWILQPLQLHKHRAINPLWKQTG
jgi:hypothetical protein